jgi:predicted ATPase
MVLAQDPALDTGPATTAAPVPRRRTGTLPVELTTFVGRTAELGAVAAALGESRVVTLTGLGGVGKTRLAIEAAHAVRDGFRHGAVFCDLSPLTEADQVAARVADALSLDGGGEDLTAIVADAIADQPALLVLDNCERVLEGVAPFVQAVVRRAPGARILATSREPLGIPGERVLAVKPFPVGDGGPDGGGAADDGADGEADDAVRLFLDRARDVRAGFAEGDPDALRAVARICRLVDGIPLAIELAATRMASMAPGELLARLDRRFEVLTGGPRTGAPRHQALRATLDWSHELLSEPARAVLARCSVFAGGFGLAAAEAVAACEAAPTAAVLDALAGLVAHSMVAADDDGGTTRYRMLDTIRFYAAERLAASGGTEDARRAHLAWCRRFLRDAADGLRGPDDVRWLARVGAESDDVRAAVATAVERHDLDALADLLGALPAGALLGTRLGSAITSTGLAVAADVGEPDHPVAAVLLSLQALDSIFRDDNDGAIERATRACAVARRHGTWLRNLPWYLACVGSVSGARTAEVLPLADEALAAAHAHDDAWAVAEMTSERATMRFLAGRVEEATAEARDGLQRARAIGCTNLVLRAELLAGMCLLAPDTDPAEALEHFDECVRLSVRVGNAFFGSAGIVVAAMLRGAASAADAARAHLGLLSTVATFHEQGLLRMFFAPVGSLLATAGEPEAAARLIGAGRVFPTKGPALSVLDAAAQAALRSALGAERHEALLADGRGLTLEQATAVAVEALTRVAAREL